MTNLLVGQSYEGWYPRANVDGVRHRYEVRKFRVLAVRDQRLEPIRLETIELDPAIRRDGALLRVWDYDKGAERSFYEGSMREVRAIEPPEEISGWQVVSGSHVIRPFVPTRDRADSCVECFEAGARGTRSAMAIPIRLPNLAGNLYRETA